MNKYALGTIIGTALLGLAKSKTKSKLGSNAKLKVHTNIDARFYGDVFISFYDFEDMYAVIPKVWNHLAYEEYEVQQSSSQQQSSEEWDDTYAYYKMSGKLYKIPWFQVLAAVQTAIALRIEDIIYDDPDFQYPEGWNPSIHSWAIEDDSFYFIDEDGDPWSYEDFVGNLFTFFYFKVYWEESNSNRILTEDELEEKGQELWGEALSAILTRCRNELGQEFGIRDIQSPWDGNYESDIEYFESELRIEKDGKWVPYENPKSKSNLRKR